MVTRTDQATGNRHLWPASSHCLVPEPDGHLSIASGSPPDAYSRFLWMRLATASEVLAAPHERDFAFPCEALNYPDFPWKRQYVIRLVAVIGESPPLVMDPGLMRRHLLSTARPDLGRYEWTRSGIDGTGCPSAAGFSGKRAGTALK